MGQTERSSKDVKDIQRSPEVSYWGLKLKRERRYSNAISRIR